MSFLFSLRVVDVCVFFSVFVFYVVFYLLFVAFFCCNSFLLLHYCMCFCLSAVGFCFLFLCSFSWMFRQSCCCTVAFRATVEGDRGTERSLSRVSCVVPLHKLSTCSSKTEGALAWLGQVAVWYRSTKNQTKSFDAIRWCT